jgi:dimethylaniline monooxygenase (N-oxide forming)
VKVAWLIPFQYLFVSRFGASLVAAHRGRFPGTPGFALRVWSILGRPFVWCAFRIVEGLFALQFWLPKHLKPKADIVDDFYGYAQVHNYDLRDKRLAGQIEVRNGQVQSFAEKGVVLTDDSFVPCDVVLFGTGFKRCELRMFDDRTRDALGIEDDGLYLYRHIFPVRVPGLAFVGSTATILNTTTWSLMAEYISRYLSGLVQLPAEAEMEAEVQRMKEWKRSWMPPTASRASLILLHQTSYHDQLLRDMHEEHRRKWPNMIAELLWPYHPTDYCGIIGRPLEVLQKVHAAALYGTDIQTRTPAASAPL